MPTDKTHAVWRGPGSLPGVFLRGILMGAADIVPGVSGGTIAFITGIYQRLLKAISALDLSIPGLLLRGEWNTVWRAVDGSFLLALLLGIVTSVFSLASLISHWLETQPLLLWSFFFGLILASTLVLTRHVAAWTWMRAVGLLLGAAIAALLGLSPEVALPGGYGSFFFAGFIAICAMILPGVSGSFILVLLGMYPAVLSAVDSLDLVSLVAFTGGAICGLLAFARLLSLLLERYHAATLATLTGFLFGSLLVVWPWKLLAAESGRSIPVLPADYAVALGESQWIPCLLLMAVGFVLVMLLETRWGGLER
ncbi:MAG: DUF368 domain-containing protein [Congregibacter sp.]